MLKIAEHTETLVTPAVDPLDEMDAEQLVALWDQTKAAELTAEAKRLQIEQRLITMLDAPVEGQKSHRIGPWKVVRKNDTNFTADIAVLLELQAELELPELTKPKLDETALKKLRKERRTDFDLLVDGKAVSFKPSKPNFTIARVATAAAVLT